MINRFVVLLIFMKNNLQHRAFLYIDILGFENLVRTNPTKVDCIFRIFDHLNPNSEFVLRNRYI